MNKILLLLAVVLMTYSATKAQTTAMQINGMDCNGVPHDLLAELDAGKAVLLHFFMPNCTACPPPALAIQAMANNIMTTYPGRITGYALPFQNSTTCEYTSSWVTSSGLPLYAPYDSGAIQVAYYGGFGMPTVVLLGGKDHQILFSTLSFSMSDTTILREKILDLFNTTGVEELPTGISSFKVLPNPASDILSVQLDINQPSAMKLEITDITGKQVAPIYTGEVIGVTALQYDISAIPSGNYFVKVQLQGKTLSRKLNIHR